MRSLSFLSRSLLLAVTLAACNGVSAPDPKQGGNQTVTFYQVPLVCGAAPEIGCGSRAKPVLRQLEHTAGIAEAWLNHAGTIIAVVGQSATVPASQVQPADAVFRARKLDAHTLPAKEYVATIQNFKGKKGWLRSAQVDQLSRIEAGEIADRVIARVNAVAPLEPQSASAMQVAMIEIISRKFTEDTSDAIAYTLRQQAAAEVLAVGQKNLNSKQLQALQAAIALGEGPVEGEKGYSKEPCCSSPTTRGPSGTSKRSGKDKCCQKPS